MADRNVLEAHAASDICGALLVFREGPGVDEDDRDGGDALRFGAMEVSGEGYLVERL